jgi:hypothetical protein
MSDYRKRWAATILPEGVSQPSVFHVSLAWHLEVFGRISSYTEPQVRALFGDTEMEIDECARRKDAMMSSLVFVDIDFAKTGIEMMRANPGRRWHFEEAGAGYGGRPVYVSEPETSPGQGGE